MASPAVEACSCPPDSSTRAPVVLGAPAFDVNTENNVRIMNVMCTVSCSPCPQGIPTSSSGSHGVYLKKTVEIMDVIFTIT